MSCDELTVRLDGSPQFAPDGGLRFHPRYQKQTFTCARLGTKALVWPGEEQFLLLLRQHLLNVPSQQALQLSAQPALKRMLGASHLQWDLVRLLYVQSHEQQFAMPQLHQPDLHLADPRLSARSFKLVSA